MGYIMQQTDVMGPFSVESRSASKAIYMPEDEDLVHAGVVDEPDGKVFFGWAVKLEVDNEHLDGLIAALEAARAARDVGAYQWEQDNAEAIESRERREANEWVDNLMASIGWG